MLTGRRAFGGEDVTDTLVVGRAARSRTGARCRPRRRPVFAGCCSRCLEKDRARALARHRRRAAAPRGREPRRRRLETHIAAAEGGERCADGDGGGGLLSSTSAGAWSRDASVATLAAPEKTRLQRSRYRPMAVSCLHGQERRPESKLWLRSLNSWQAQEVAGTEDAGSPFWSPDSRFIGFFAEGEAPKDRRDRWSRTNAVRGSERPGRNVERRRRHRVRPDQQRRIVPRARVAGGLAVPITSPETGTHRYPAFLPDGRRFLYTRLGAKENGVYLGSLDSSSASNPAQRTLLDESNARYVAPSAPGELATLLFLREGILLAQRVDPHSLEMKGDVVPVAGPVSPGYDTGYNLFSISSNGVLVV